jgi:hypothetical protein
MRSSYGISFTSRALRGTKTFLSAALLASALLGILTLGSAASASPEPAALSAETAAAGAEVTETTPATQPAIEGEQFVILGLVVLFAAWLVVRTVLAPVGRHEFPFGRTHPGI